MRFLISPAVTLTIGSKGLSDITGFSQQGGNQGWSDADPTRIRQIEYGIAENDIQNRFALSLNYEFQY